MKPSVSTLICSALFLVFIFSSQASAQQSCESLKSIEIRNVTITSVEKGDPGYELPAQSGFVNMPPQKINKSF